MKEKKPMSANYALGLTKLCFHGGFVLTMLSLAIVSATDLAWIMYVLCIPGFVVMIGGLIFGYAKVHCPYCGKSLMLGRRLPSHLPDYCPGCGNVLDETD